MSLYSLPGNSRALQIRGSKSRGDSGCEEDKRRARVGDERGEEERAPRWLRGGEPALGIWDPVMQPITNQPSPMSSQSTAGFGVTRICEPSGCGGMCSPSLTSGVVCPKLSTPDVHPHTAVGCSMQHAPLGPCLDVCVPYRLYACISDYSSSLHFQCPDGQ
eukprot:1179023-Prorocentrum_minimum.AAC.3